jgi:hypothetical protein
MTPSELQYLSTILGSVSLTLNTLAMLLIVIVLSRKSRP